MSRGGANCPQAQSCEVAVSQETLTTASALSGEPLHQLQAVGDPQSVPGTTHGGILSLAGPSGATRTGLHFLPDDGAERVFVVLVDRFAVAADDSHKAALLWNKGLHAVGEKPVGDREQRWAGILPAENNQALHILGAQRGPPPCCCMYCGCCCTCTCWPCPGWCCG